MDNRQMWMEQILRLLELATEEQLRVLYTAALYIVRGRRQNPKRLGFWQERGGGTAPFLFEKIRINT